MVKIGLNPAKSQLVKRIKMLGPGASFMDLRTYAESCFLSC